MHLVVWALGLFCCLVDTRYPFADSARQQLFLATGYSAFGSLSFTVFYNVCKKEGGYWKPAPGIRYAQHVQVVVNGSPLCMYMHAKFYAIAWDLSVRRWAGIWEYISSAHQAEAAAGETAVGEAAAGEAADVERGAEGGAVVRQVIQDLSHVCNCISDSVGWHWDHLIHLSSS